MWLQELPQCHFVRALPSQVTWMGRTPCLNSVTIVKRNWSVFRTDSSRTLVSSLLFLCTWRAKLIFLRAGHTDLARLELEIVVCHHNFILSSSPCAKQSTTKHTPKRSLYCDHPCSSRPVERNLTLCVLKYLHSSALSIPWFQMELGVPPLHASC